MRDVSEQDFMCSHIMPFAQFIEHEVAISVNELEIFL